MTVYNFCAGPAMLPTSVMEAAQAEFLNWRGLGVSVMEISHRGQHFIDLTQEIERNFRSLLSIPDNYHVLFLHGGAQTQFSAVPMNLLGNFNAAAYAVTGFWGKKAYIEASKFTQTHLVANTEPTGFNEVPAQCKWDAFSKEAYLHYVDNETINGVEFAFVPEASDVPLVCDMSSNLLSKPVDVSRYGLIYACAQKNLGMAGVTVVIVRDDLLQRAPMNSIPSILDYREQVKQHSMFNTPPTYAWYMAGKVFEWVQHEGGLAVMQKKNNEKAAKLYDLIDQTDFYSNTVQRSSRSVMNVPFALPTPELDALFVKKAADDGLVALKGHKLAGGIRASIYNAMPVAGVDALVSFMRQFEKAYG